MEYDFSGYATRNDVQCSDGRIIRRDAFAQNDHTQVPLVWQHDHMSPSNVLGHAMLENREDGVYTYGVFNNTPEGLHAKELVKNGDIRALSIYANKLKHQGRDVVHGAIREVSLVLAGANPGAFIDTVIAHADSDEEEAEIRFVNNESSVLFHSDKDLKKDLKKDEEDSEEDEEDSKEESDDVKDDNNDNVEDVEASDDESNEKKKKEKNMANSISHADEEKTIQDVIDTMNEEQKNVLYALVGMAAEGGNGSEEEKDEDMKHNAFSDDYENDDYLMHAEDMAEILRDAKRYGSLRESALQHGYEDIRANESLMHGITGIDTLFPDAKNIVNVPGFVSREMGWVQKVMGAVSHTPFSRIKTIFADIREDEARAKGYIKSKQKKDEVFTLLKRTTDPQTVYKKQKLDRDDVVDITDFDVVSWLKGEMRMMLDEELARAFMIGDGRETSSDDKINPLHIRPIWGDDPFYTIRAQIELATEVTEDDKYKAIIRAAIKARKDYKGSGNPTFYTTEENLTGMLLLTDSIGRDLYESEEQLAKKLRVKEIVTVPVMEGQKRSADDKDTGLTGKKFDLEGIVANLSDYNVGADKGGAVSLFDDFDIDYNAMKYLIETRCSGALVKPYAAIAIETYPKA